MSQLPDETPLRNSKIERLDLGDCFADDEQLRSTLKALAKEANKDSPCSHGRHLRELMSLVTGPFKVLLTGAQRTFLWLSDRLSNYEIRRAQAKKITAEASEIQTLASARAQVIEAQAERIRSGTRLREIQQLQALGVEWRAEVNEEGHLDIVVTKDARLSDGSG